jgi:two-component system, OmpR family, sensor histidine kinase KdpD
MTVARWQAPQPSHPGVEAAELQRHVNAGRLAASVSHEVMSALGVVQTELGFLCDLMSGSLHSNDARSMADDARTAMSRAVQRVAAVVSLARARPCEVAKVDVKEAIGAAIFELDARLSAFTLVRDLQAVPLALADRGSLLQTLVTALLDAADVTPVRGRIVVGLRSEGSQVLVTIEDQGPAPLSIANASDRPNTTLSISRAVVRSFGGELTISFGPMGGRRVAIRLPAA